MKNYFGIAFLLLICDPCYCQPTQSVTFGIDYSITSANFGATKSGIGGSADYQIKFNAPVGLQFHIGYSHFKNKVLSNDVVNFLPVRAGVVGFLYQDVIFIFADAGISHYSASSGTKQNGFSFGIGPGYKLYFNPDKKQFLQLSAYFNLHHFYSNYSGGYNYTWFNIRAAYGLSFSKKPIEK